MSPNYHIYPNLLQIPKAYNAFLVDAYGVFWGGGQGVIPGSAEIMEKLVSSGKIVGILSNSTQLAEKEIAKLDKHGMEKGKHFHFLITSGEVAKRIFRKGGLPFKTPGNTYFLSSGVHPKYSPPHVIFQDSPYKEAATIQEADFIYISIPHINGEDQTDLELFRGEIIKLAKTGLPMVCANPDRYAHEGNPPRAVVRQGSIARIFEEAGGKVFYVGKPDKNVYSAAMEYFRERNIVKPEEILMVGDTPETDIRGARQFGMASVLVTKTGVMADRISLQGLKEAIKSLPSQDLPDYYIEQMAAL